MPSRLLKKHKCLRNWLTDGYLRCQRHMMLYYSHFNVLLCPFMPLVPFPEWLSHLYKLMAKKHSDGEGSRTIMFEFWAISAQSTSQLFPEMLEKTLPDLFHLALPDAQQIGPCTTLQRINPASPNSQRPHVSAAEAVMSMCLGISKQQHDRQHSWLNLDNRQTK